MLVASRGVAASPCKKRLDEMLLANHVRLVPGSPQVLRISSSVSASRCVHGAATNGAPGYVAPMTRFMDWAHGIFTGHERLVTSSFVPESREDLIEIANLWAVNFDRPELLEEGGLTLVEKALRHSFTIEVAYAERDYSKGEGPPVVDRKVIGCARTVSDGVFAAQVVDVAVNPVYQRRGVGSGLLRALCKNTRACGAQSIAVFTDSETRLFFWKAGFRLDLRYKVMMYMTNAKKVEEEVSVDELAEIFSSR